MWKPGFLIFVACCQLIQHKLRFQRAPAKTLQSCGSFLIRPKFKWPLGSYRWPWRCLTHRVAARGPDPGLLWNRAFRVMNYTRALQNLSVLCEWHVDLDGTFANLDFHSILSLFMLSLVTFFWRLTAKTTIFFADQWSFLIHHFFDVYWLKSPFQMNSLFF